MKDQSELDARRAGEKAKKLFAFLDGEKNKNWVALDSFPGFLANDLLRYLKAVWRETPHWILPERSADKDFLEKFQNATSPTLILDATHVSEKPRVAALLKRLLLLDSCPKVIALGSGNLRGLDLPNHYGEGVHFNCESILEAEIHAHELKHGSDDSMLLQHAHRLIPKYSMEDLVLGPKAMMKLNECVDYIRTKETCEWELGFRDRHSRGHGVTLLFHGASGTGKTMAAEVIAATTDLKLYQVDLSSVVSKWVGETEKNLKAIFKAAKGVRGILLFDEGDAIFGQRTQVKGSQDRYSNLEVNYLLQEIEKFDGIVVLSTNHEKNLDPAFLRRFTYSVTFGFPATSERSQIWARNIPTKLKVGASVDFEHLALIALSGGNIKNCVRDAAAIAVTKGRKHLEQIDLLWAIKRELQKDGRDLDRALVGEKYWPQVALEWEYKLFPKLAKKVTPPHVPEISGN